MIFLILYLSFIFFAVGAGFLAGLSDFKGMNISNKLPACVFLLFFCTYGAANAADVDVFDSLSAHILSGAAVFVITFVMFVFRVFGGGDAKLITAYSFWFTVPGMAVFFVYVTFIGALLAVAAYILQKKTLFPKAPEGSWPARAQQGESVVPYGIAIGAGAVIGFVQGGYLSPEILSLFLVPASG